mgnify:CR=1 FL=1
MAPSSYQPPTRGDKAEGKTHSQTAESNLAQSTATVSKVLEAKGRDIVAVRPDDTIATVVGVLRDKRIGAVLVTDDAGALVGILSERDIVRELSDVGKSCLDQPVSAYMTSKLVTCTSKDTAQDILGTMTEGRFRHMPVMDGDAMIGLISIGDVVKAQLAVLAMEKEALEGMIKGF